MGQRHLVSHVHKVINAGKYIFHDFLSSADFFQINIFKNFYQKLKQFGSRSDMTFCQDWSGSKLFAKVIIRRRWQAKSHYVATSHLV